MVYIKKDLSQEVRRQEYLQRDRKRNGLAEAAMGANGQDTGVIREAEGADVLMSTQQAKQYISNIYGDGPVSDDEDNTTDDDNSSEEFYDSISEGDMTLDNRSEEENETPNAEMELNDMEGGSNGGSGSGGNETPNTENELNNRENEETNNEEPQSGNEMRGVDQAGV